MLDARDGESLRPVLRPVVPLLADGEAAAAPANLLHECSVLHGVLEAALLRALRSTPASGLRGALQGALQRRRVSAGEGGNGLTRTLRTRRSRADATSFPYLNSLNSRTRPRAHFSECRLSFLVGRRPF